MYMFSWLFFLCYICLFIVTWWFYFGYLMFIFLRASLSEEEIITSSSHTLPTITILIPCLNEELVIERKIKNISSLDYPQNKFTAIFIDGGSTDKTVEIIERDIKKQKNLKYIHAKNVGKIPQLNEVLPTVHTDIIVCTDADGEMDATALKVISSGLENKKIGVVGIKTIPHKTLPEEAYFWDQQNRLRIAETKYFSPLYIIAVCYGFRREILEQFPPNVIADDIYISFLAIAKKYKVIYTDKASVVELRCPSSYSILIKHKIRKTNASLIEIFRFFFIFLHAPVQWKLIFYTRAAQILVGPFFLFSLGFIFVYVLITSATGILPFATVLLLILTYLFIRPSALSGFFKKVKTFIIVMAVIIYSVLMYPFYKQTSKYRKIS